MTSTCLLCNRSFLNEEALQKHKRDSPKHASDCTACNRHFSNVPARDQHLRDSPAHSGSFNRDNRDRSLSKNETLEQRIKASPAHVNSIDCSNCNRSFSTKEAFEQHKRESPAHAESFDCNSCNRSFGSKEALEQHTKDSPGHLKSFDCKDCNRSFASKEALEQHKRDSPFHQQAPETPLDAFFRSFPTFGYDASLPPATSYARLQAHQRWRREDTASSDAWDRYQHALEDELRLWFGDEDDLAAWHALCHAIGIEPPPQTCERCEQAVRRTHVNIVDLIEWGRNRRSNEGRVLTFRDVAGLRAYTKRTAKIFRNTFDREEEDSNVVLRHLLRKIFV